MNLSNAERAALAGALLSKGDRAAKFASEVVMRRGLGTTSTPQTAADYAAAGISNAAEVANAGFDNVTTAFDAATGAGGVVEGVNTAATPPMSTTKKVLIAAGVLVVVGGGVLLLKGSPRRANPRHHRKHRRSNGRGYFVQHKKAS